MTAVIVQAGTCAYCHTEQSDLIYGEENRRVCRDARACMARRHGEPEPAVSPPHPEPLLEPISGRSQPRPAPLPNGFKHDVRWRSDGLGIYAQCLPCGPAKHHIDEGHRAEAFVRFERQHAGIEDPVPEEVPS